MDDLELAFDITLGLEGIPARGLELVLPSSTFSSTDTLKVGLWLGDDYCPVEAEIIEGIKRAGLALEAAGASVEEAKPDFQLAEHHETYVMHLAPIIGAGFGSDDIDKMRAIVDAEFEYYFDPDTFGAVPSRDAGTAGPPRTRGFRVIPGGRDDAR